MLAVCLYLYPLLRCGGCSEFAKKRVVAHQGGERAYNCASRLVAVQSSVQTPEMVRSTSDVSGATDNRHGGDC